MTKIRKPIVGFNAWDVIKVPFPYTNRPVQQNRPGLVVGRHDAPGSPHLLWVLMITSAGHRPWKGDVLISDLGAAGLPVASVVRVAKIATIEAVHAQRIGALAAADRGGVLRHFRSWIADIYDETSTADTSANQL